jgi:hypothetical protein
MNTVTLDSEFQSVRRTIRVVSLAFFVALALLAGGCVSPVKGPTDPKEFITRQRQWTNSPDAAAPAAPAPAPSDLATPASVPPANGTTVEPK